MSKNKLICIVGMCGAGKSEVADYMMGKRQFGYVRFGQITLDEVKRMGKKPNEALEKKIREAFRKKHGMAAFAILNGSKFDDLLKTENVIGDGLYSWEEYVYLKDKYGDQFVCLAVYAPPGTRYRRLDGRAKKHGTDDDLRFRSFTPAEAASRDKAEIENLNKAGPIVMADYLILNTQSIPALRKRVDETLEQIFD